MFFLMQRHPELKSLCRCDCECGYLQVGIGLVHVEKQLKCVAVVNFPSYCVDMRNLGFVLCNIVRCFLFCVLFLFVCLLFLFVLFCFCFCLFVCLFWPDRFDIKHIIPVAFYIYKRGQFLWIVTLTGDNIQALQTNLFLHISIEPGA